MAGGSFPELVQLPINVLDQRLLTDGTIRALAARGVEIHARSIFLQGLLLIPPDAIPAPLGGLRDPVANFQKLAAARRLSPLEAALGFVLRIPEIRVGLCGVQALGEFDALLAAAKRSADLDPRWFADARCDEPELLDPSAWPALDAGVGP